ncbi:MAG: protein kinase [Myxococcales bacterium]|nr:protein kinase [Myxococcales bacterium]
MPPAPLDHDVLLAYAHADAEVARSLGSVLGRLEPRVGVVLVRQGTVPVGVNRISWLAARMDPCGTLVALVSSQSTGDALMMEAVRLGLARAHADHAFRIIPVFLEPTPTPHGLGILDPLDADGSMSTEEIAERLLRRTIQRTTSGTPPYRGHRAPREGEVQGERYALLECLGRGRRTTTFKAQDRARCDALVVVKRLHPPLVDDPRALQGFMRSARLTAELVGRGVPRLVPRRGPVALDDGGRRYLVEDLIPGPSLQHAIVARRVGPRVLLGVIEQVGATLEALHAHGHAHHYVTPTNILLDEAGVPWLTDLDATGSCHEGSIEALAHCAPEVLDGDRTTDARADVFSLAMVMAFGLGRARLLDALLDRSGFLARLECSPRVRALLAEALAHEPEHRPATVEALCTRLRQAWEEGGGGPRSSSRRGGLGPRPKGPGSSDIAAISDLDRERVRRNVLADIFSIPASPIKVGRYELRRRLDRGATGQVHVAFDPVLACEIAVKLVALDTLERLAVDQRRRLLHEAQALAALGHPNVVHVYEIDAEADPPFIAMELVDGKNLAQWIDDAQPVWTEIVDVFLEAGQGLAAAHEAGLIHHDFKPQNVMIDEAPPRQVRVTDFGLARTQLDEPVVTEIAGREVWAGTPLYMAPEQVRNLATPRSDQFAFCVSLYECLFGAPPFPGATVEEIQARIALGPPTPDDLRGVPPALLSLVHTGLAADERDRHPSMAVLLRALAKVRG